MVCTFIGVALVGLVLGRMEHEGNSKRFTVRADGDATSSIGSGLAPGGAEGALAGLGGGLPGVRGSILSPPTPPAPATGPASTADGGEPDRLSIEQDATTTAIQDQSQPTVSDIEQIVCSFAWPCGQALSVMWCESKNDPNAISPYGHRGLFQLATGWATNNSDYWTRWMEPAWNIALAYHVWTVQGYGAWSCR